MNMIAKHVVKTALGRIMLIYALVSSSKIIEEVRPRSLEKLQLPPIAIKLLNYTFSK